MQQVFVKSHLSFDRMVGGLSQEDVRATAKRIKVSPDHADAESQGTLRRRSLVAVRNRLLR